MAGPIGDPYWDSFLTLGAQGEVLDSMKVADLRPVAKPVSAGEGLYGFHTGTNAADFRDRIGVKESADGGVTWSEIRDLGTLIGPGPEGTFDAGGVACPAPLPIGDDSGWYVYHTSLSVDGASRIGLHSVSADFKTVTRSLLPVITPGAGFDAAGQADPVRAA